MSLLIPELRIPQLSFTHFPSNLGRSWSLNGASQCIVQERKEDDDIEQHEFRRLTNYQEINEASIKSEPGQSQEAEDHNLVTWSSESEPTNPLNWPNRKRWTAALLVASFTFISRLAATMITPALDTIADEFKISNDIEKVLVMSVFLLAYAIGRFLLGGGRQEEADLKAEFKVWTRGLVKTKM